MKYPETPPTEEEFMVEATALRTAYPVSDDEFDGIIKNLKASLQINMDVGVYIYDENTDHKSWLPSRRADVDFYYWGRYKRYLEDIKLWNSRVTTKLDTVSSEIVDLLGDPENASPWLRRGLVLGDVQSGKTATYTAICNKAADTGYKVIIVLSGMMETLAWLARLIDTQYTQHALDLQIIWNKQRVPDFVSDQMKILTKAVYESITSPSRPVANVTQWCKQEECWKRIMALPLKLDARMETVLEDKREAQSAERVARKDQKTVSGIEAQTTVVNFGAEYWKKMLVFGPLRRLATIADMNALKIACQMPARLPNSVQSHQLLTLRERMVSEGWKD